MTSQRQRVLTFGLALGVILVSLGWLAGGPLRVAPPGTATSGAQAGEEARLNALALKELKETQDEVTKMKAHGIGMPPVKAGKPGG